MLSAPPPTAASTSPSMMYCDALTIACSPLPHSRFSVSAPLSCGRPPLTAATRDRYMSLRFGVDDVAEDALADRPRDRPSARPSPPGRRARPARSAAMSFSAAAVIADRGARAVDDDDFPCVGHGCLLSRNSHYPPLGFPPRGAGALLRCVGRPHARRGPRATVTRPRAGAPDGGRARATRLRDTLRSRAFRTRRPRARRRCCSSCWC